MFILKVIIIVDNFNNNTIIRQPWNYAYKLSKELSLLQNEVTILTNIQEETDHDDGLSIEIPVIQLPVNTLREINKYCINSIKDMRPDLMYWFGNSLSGVYLNNLYELNIPLFLHISSPHHSVSELRHLSWSELARHRLHVATAIFPGNYLPRLLNNKNLRKIIVTSPYIKQNLVQFGVNQEKILVSPLVFDKKSKPNLHDVMALDVRQKLNLTSDVFVVTYLGSPDFIRGVDTLVLAVAKLKELGINFKLVLLLRQDRSKEKKYEILLHKIIQTNNLNDDVIVLQKNLGRSELYSFILASDVIALPFKITLSEPPLSILESMAFGRPVITTNVAGLPGLVDVDRGMLVTPNDVSSLSKALSYLSINPKQIETMGSNALSYIENLSTWPKLGKWYHSLMKKTINNEIT